MSITIDKTFVQYIQDIMKDEITFESKLFEFVELIRKQILGDQIKFQDLPTLLGADTSLNMVCGKSLYTNELFYRCLDCDKTSNTQDDHSTYALQCEECFKKSNHEGHEIMQKYSSNAATCDCGDIAIWDKEGFCSDHTGYSKEKAQQIIQLIPNDIAINFVSTLISIFYNTFYMYEQYLKGLETKNNVNFVGQKQVNESASNKSNTRRSINIFLHKILTLINEFLEVNVGFRFLFIQVLYSSIDSEKQDRELMHDCKDYFSLNLLKEDDNDPDNSLLKHECKCTILENIFRFFSVLG